MALEDTTYLKIGGKPLRFASEQLFTRPWAMRDKTAGIFLLNQDTDGGETSTLALDRGGKNRAPGAAKDPETRKFILDSPAIRRIPTPSQNYWTGKFAGLGNTPMQTALVDTGDSNCAATNTWVVYLVAAMHKADAALLNSGVNAANNHAQVIGSYGNTIFTGWGFEFFRPVGMRLLTYDMVLGVRTVNLGLPGTETDANPGDGLAGPWVEADLKCDLFRIFRLDVLPSKFIATNVSADSAVDTVEVTTPNGRRAGGQPISILGRVSPLASTNYLLGCSVVVADIKTDIPTALEHDIIVSQIREQMRIAGIVELSSIG